MWHKIDYNLALPRDPTDELTADFQRASSPWERK